MLAMPGEPVSVCLLPGREGTVPPETMCAGREKRNAGRKGSCIVYNACKKNGEAWQKVWGMAQACLSEPIIMVRKSRREGRDGEKGRGESESELVRGER